MEDCSRGITEESIKEVLDKIRKDNGVVINSPEVKAMVQGRDRKPDLGYFLAMSAKNKINA